jgi:excisionase family DNA binding protein
MTKCLTMTVPEAGAALGISRNSAYAAALRGEIPTIRIGKKLLVPVAAFDRLLDPTRPVEGEGLRLKVRGP